MIDCMGSGDAFTSTLAIYYGPLGSYLGINT